MSIKAFIPASSLDVDLDDLPVARADDDPFAARIAVEADDIMTSRRANVGEVAKRALLLRPLVGEQPLDDKSIAAAGEKCLLFGFFQRDKGVDCSGVSIAAVNNLVSLPDWGLLC